MNRAGWRPGFTHPFTKERRLVAAADTETGTLVLCAECTAMRREDIPECWLCGATATEPADEPARVVDLPAPTGPAQLPLFEMAA